MTWLAKNKQSTLAIITLLVLVASLPTAARTIVNPLSGTFCDIIQRIVNFANALLAPLSTLMVLIAGFLYMTGGGDPEKLKKAHRVLIYALIGIAIVLLANSAEVIIRDVLNARRAASQRCL